MKYFYSPSTAGFYMDEIHDSMPEDVFEVAEKEYHMLFDGQASGKKIVYKSRKLQLIDQPAQEVSWEDIRATRDRLLAKCDWTQMPDVQMSDELKGEWLAYRQSLRDITTAFTKPAKVIWPEVPGTKE